jgi:hypothetical protein
MEGYLLVLWSLIYQSNNSEVFYQKRITDQPWHAQTYTQICVISETAVHLITFAHSCTEDIILLQH